MLKPLARRRFTQRVKKLDYPAAADLLRGLIEARYDDPRAMRILAERAWATAPDDATAEIMRRLWTAFAAGRRVGFGAGGQTTSVDGVPVELIDAVNEVFEQGEQ